MSTRPTTGKLYKGSNFDKKTMAAFDKAKIMDLMVFYYYLLFIISHFNNCFSLLLLS
jgi:hypothetical protein